MNFISPLAPSLDELMLIVQSPLVSPEERQAAVQYIVAMAPDMLPQVSSFIPREAPSRVNAPAPAPSVDFESFNKEYSTRQAAANSSPMRDRSASVKPTPKPAGAKVAKGTPAPKATLRTPPAKVEQRRTASPSVAPIAPRMQNSYRTGQVTTPMSRPATPVATGD